MRRTTIIVLLALAVAGISVGAVGATAQNTTAANDTTTAVDAADNSVSLQLSDTLVLKSWEFEDGAFVLRFGADIPASVSVTDSGALMGALAEGSGSSTQDIPYESYTLTSGETTVRFDATVVDGEAAVSVGSSESVKLIRTDSIRAEQPPVEQSAVQVLVLGTAVAVGFGSVLFVRRRRDDESIEVERLD